ncbi:hypothetical protein CRUP_003831 [Coryphaenoides rupestris]|nr:hypothetical protein CRUP_003831 [Coryphaenoides rupestris]
MFARGRLTRPGAVHHVPHAVAPIMSSTCTNHFSTAPRASEVEMSWIRYAFRPFMMVSRRPLESRRRSSKPDSEGRLEDLTTPNTNTTRKVNETCGPPPGRSAALLEGILPCMMSVRGEDGPRRTLRRVVPESGVRSYSTISDIWCQWRSLTPGLHRTVMAKAKRKGMEELLLRRANMTTELEKLGSKMEALAQSSELDMTPQYLSDVRMIQKRLHDAEEAITFVNKEEALYQWEVTRYPELDAIKENIDPYQRFFSLGMEEEVDEFFRESYKMLKSFQQKQKKADQEQDKMSASARRKPRQDYPSTKPENPMILMCSQVLDQVKEFKEHIPMVTVLCNPGVRDRHWHQMSEIVEYDLTPDSGTTLRKVLKQNLTPYLERSNTERMFCGHRKQVEFSSRLSRLEDVHVQQSSWTSLSRPGPCRRPGAVRLSMLSSHCCWMGTPGLLSTHCLRNRPPLP